MTETTTFIIIKPDAINRRLIGEVISRLERKELCITRMEMRHKNYTWCRQHYQHIYNKQKAREDSEPIYSYLELFMSNVPLIGIEIYGDNVVKIVKKLVGCTDSIKAEPGTIRGDYGTTPVCYNMIHAADSEESARHEIQLFFNPKTDWKV